MTHTHSRTYDYEARQPDLALMQSMSGLDYLRGILKGVHPGAPISATLGFQPIEFELGRAVFAGTPAPFLYNPLGTVHGGWAATLLDSAMGCAVHTTLPVGKIYTTLDISIHLVRAITTRAKPLRCEAEIVHAGGTIATAQGRLVDEAGILYAHATTTCLVIAPK